MKSRLVSTVATTAIVLMAAFLLTWYWPRTPPAGHAEAATEAPTDPPSSLVLTALRVKAAGIESESADIRSLQAERTVPGRIQYDETRHIELRLATDGVIRELRVRPGDRLEAGQVVALVDSPEIGQRRADVLLCNAEERLADREQKQATDTQTNLSRLLARLKESVDLPSLLTEFENQPLGEHREPILAAYSKRILADRLIAKLQPLATEGIASGRSLLEQQSARETAQAAFQSACETARIHAAQRTLKADAMAADARRRTAIARERLGSYIGTNDEEGMLGDHETSPSLWRLKSPIAGTVEVLPIAAKERVTTTTSLMTIADTTSLWVHAEIRDRDWGALHLVHGQRVRMEASAFPGQFEIGEVVYVGRTQEAETRAVPIVIRVANELDRLRPGMFARVFLPEGEPREVLTVPASAFIQHERRQFVFVEESPGVFRDVDIVPGLRNADWIEVQHGLTPGMKVVSRGAFALKGELLLEPEE